MEGADSSRNGRQDDMVRLIPELATWLDRKHGQVGFYLAQALSGHGCFNAYLKRFKKRDDESCHYCKCTALAINTTKQDIEFSAPRQEVIPFDFIQFPGDEFSDSEAENSLAYPQEELRGNYSDRVNRAIRSLHISHFIPEEKEYVFHRGGHSFLQ